MPIKFRFRRKKTEHQAEQKPPFLNAGTKSAQNEQNTFFNTTSSPQAKLEIGKANDPSEQQADSVADHVVAGSGKVAEGRNIQKQSEEEDPQAKLQRQEEEEPQAKLDMQRQEEEEPQAKFDVQRQEEEEMQTKREVQKQEEEDMQAKQIQRKAQSTSESFETRVDAAKNGGFALPDEVRNDVEDKLNFDFTHVRIHTGREAEQLCNEINAQAFTTGYHIFFNKGRYQPGSASGKHLLVHELTHVMQQKGE